MNDLLHPGEILPGITELPAGFTWNFRKTENSYTLEVDNNFVTTSLGGRSREEAVQCVFLDVVYLLQRDVDG